MKKIVLFLVLALSLLRTHAQIKKGQWLIGGNGSARFVKEDDFKSKEFTIAPDAGYFFRDKLAGGLRVNLTHAVAKEWGIKFATDTYYSLSPFVRYYLLSKTAKLNPFLDGGVYLGRVRQKGTTDEIFRTTTYGYSATGGIAYFIKNLVALEAQLSLDKRDGKNSDFSSTLVTGKVGLQFHL